MSGVEAVVIDENRVSRITVSPRSWGIYLFLGIAWMLLGILIMSYHVETLSVLAVFTGIAFLAGGVTEIVDAFKLQSGFRWLLATFGALSVAVGIVAIAWPQPTLYVIAVLIGWYLVIMGIVHFVVALFHTHQQYWWAGLVLGLVEFAIGAWAASYPGKSLTVFAVLIGVWALVHGIIEIFAAFVLRGLERDVRATTG
ncbi:MAG TPA: HdeD family acid-resistance protein [Acidimicrobiia bacterium]|nr:HdeD family acid-resistance protein [Acidimicrobiia bacterium]